MKSQLHNINVRRINPLMTPDQIKSRLPASGRVKNVVGYGRNLVGNILTGRDKRFLVIVGPCSIHDPQAAIDYATRLGGLPEQVFDQLAVVMRVYFEKPRSTTGWKGLINDPYLDSSFRIEEGLKLARSLLIKINELGLPVGTEFLDPIIPQYLDDLIAWAAIGARTTEAQTHREMASALSMPVGFKNGTDGNVAIGVNAMLAAREPHSFLGVDGNGRVGVVRSSGNQFGHIVLRGGSNGTNYHRAAIDSAVAMLRKADLPEVVMVDCSHANCHKDHKLQRVACESLIDQKVEGNPALIGAMLESNIHAGKQDFPVPDGKSLKYGVSITDPCLGFAETEELLIEAAKKLSAVLK